MLIGLFLLAAAAVWVAGIKVSETTDVLSVRFKMGEALGGLVILAVVTNLPEIAIVVSAAMRRSMELAVGNILGGIAAQTVVLVLIDRFSSRQSRPLTYRAASLELVLEGLLVITVLSLVLAGTQFSPGVARARLEPVGLLIAVVWIGGVWAIAKFSDRVPWKRADIDPNADEAPSTQAVAATVDVHAPVPGAPRKRARPTDHSTVAVMVTFVLGAVVTLAAGMVLEVSGSEIADRLDVSGAIFGATVLAAATSLPELSTGLKSVSMGDIGMAVGDIFGGNAFLPVLFFVATLITGSAVLPHAGHSDVFLTAVGILLTVVFVVGLLFRPTKRIWGMGADSLAVLVIYAAAVVALPLLA